MKRLALLVLMVVAGSCLFAAGNVIELKFGHYLVESHPAHIAAQAFADAVAARTNGQIKITIFPNSALGSTQEMLEQTTLGALDLVIPTEPAIAKVCEQVQPRHRALRVQGLCRDRQVLRGRFLKWANPDLEKAGP